MQRHFSPDIVHVTCFSSIRVLRQTETVEPWTAPESSREAVSRSRHDIMSFPLIPEIGFQKLKWRFHLVCGPPLATATGQHDSSSRVQTHRFHWLHHCNKLMVAPSSAADKHQSAAWKRWTPRLASPRTVAKQKWHSLQKVRARVGAKGWAARGPSSSSCKIISAYEIPTQGCTSTS
ncbi:hypothetical protein CI102_12423 [Trichoderma harzianum]|uniref:Uncharacterized protein n=1 Tax=Trichoderma harzianum CBS 226.95 TaxID=983964 RepID=A0A2T3ZTF7_TRIHA|nr:hypothetical protein M431DRAFT_335707 [Trichoderma harzianum CBS 226.95]PKK42317.1 hypothetical protein CI102_12423 [Trichoderma harzianum]PTB48091.1 hypothetical protein M431DRAFT_335707 [Trichoderma harzianum CBS 226.95]